MATRETYDVIIIGAGVAGCATAIALKNQNPALQIAVIEREIFDTDTLRIGETLPPQASQQLQRLGIYESFLSCQFLMSYGTSSAWGVATLNTNEFMYSPFGYGWHLNRLVFDQFMIKEATQRGVTFYYKTSCDKAVKENQLWSLEGSSANHKVSFLTRFVVDASGKKAAFATRQGITKIAQDQLVGIYNYYEISQEYTSTIGCGALVETDAWGWWYSASLPNNLIVMGYMTDADIANSLQLRKETALQALLARTKYTQTKVDGAYQVSPQKIVASHTQYLSEMVGNGWLAVGDAASSYDPISSSGIYKSLTMSQFAAFAILNFLQENPVGLQKYQQMVRHDFQVYQEKKKAYYQQEIRYSEQAFWKRRQQVTTNRIS